MQTTEVYARVDSKQKREAIEKAYADVVKREEPSWMIKEAVNFNDAQLINVLYTVLLQFTFKGRNKYLIPSVPSPVKSNIINDSL